MPGTEHNTNNLRSGRHSRRFDKVSRNGFRCGLRSSNLPRDLKTVENDALAVRRELEDAVMQVHGEIGIMRAALINSAVRHEVRARASFHWLRTAPKLTLADKQALLRDASSATDNRDRCIDRLKLDRDSRETLLAQLYSQPALPEPPQRPPEPEPDQDIGPAQQNAADGRTEPHKDTQAAADSQDPAEQTSKTADPEPTGVDTQDQRR